MAFIQTDLKAEIKTMAVMIISHVVLLAPWPLIDVRDASVKDKETEYLQIIS